MKSEFLFFLPATASILCHSVRTFHIPAFHVLSQFCHLFFLDLWTDSVTQKDTLWGVGWQWHATGLKAPQIDSRCALYYNKVKELKFRASYFMLGNEEEGKYWLTIIEHLSMLDMVATASNLGVCIRTHRETNLGARNCLGNSMTVLFLFLLAAVKCSCLSYLKLTILSTIH